MTEDPRLSRAVELFHREERRLPDVLHRADAVRAGLRALQCALRLQGGQVCCGPPTQQKARVATPLHAGARPDSKALGARDVAPQAAASAQTVA